MRDIKFRAWNKNDGNFIYATLFDFVENGFRICEASKPYNNMPCTRQKAFVDDEYLADFLKTCFYASTAEWKQYTGLKDKNGKEVYEGDIVMCCNKLYEVEYDKYQFGLKGFYESYFDNPCDAFSEASVEVVGNIHEDPELVGVI